MRSQDDKPAPDGKAPARPVHVEHPHDETYSPGYHEGGSRFGFFNGQDNAGLPVDSRKTSDKR